MHCIVFYCLEREVEVFLLLWLPKLTYKNLLPHVWCVIQQEGEDQLYHLVMFNKVTLGSVLAFTASKQGMLQVIALHSFQALEMLAPEQWTCKVVWILKSHFLFNIWSIFLKHTIAWSIYYCIYYSTCSVTGHDYLLCRNWIMYSCVPWV